MEALRHLDGRLRSITLALIVVASIAAATHAPAHAEGEACNRTAPQVAQADDATKAEVLHRCPKFALEDAGDDFFISGDLPFTEDEELAKAHVIERSNRNCASGSANFVRVRLIPLEESGKRYWLFTALGKCL